MLIKDILQNNDKNSIILDSFQKAKDSQTKINSVVTFVEPNLNYKAGKLSGVPIVLKDNVSTKGILTTASSKILGNYIPPFNATIIDKLNEQGAVLIAKSSMDELAMGGTNLTAATGFVYNPYDQSRMAGGSSGGSAALVAAGVVPFAIGSDTGDSVRKPASYCGVVGVKPTYGKISRYGIIPYASSLDHVGYFTRCVDDAALALEVLQGHDEKDMTSSHDLDREYLTNLNSDLNGKKVLVFGNVVNSIDNQTIVDTFNQLVQQMQNKGAIVEVVNFDETLLKAILPTYYFIANCEATANHSNLDGIRFGVQMPGDTMEDIMINSRTHGLGSHIRERFVIGSFGLFEENQDRMFKKAQKVRRLIVDMIKEKLKDADVLLAPASGSVAPLIDKEHQEELSDEYLIAENHMVIGNFGGFPSMTLPLGYENGLPFGINLTSNLFDEQTMFDIAAGIENITGLKDAKVDL